MQQKEIKTVYEICCLMQVLTEKLEELPEDNGFRKNNEPKINEFIEYLESNIEPTTILMNMKQVESYQYICNKIRKEVSRINLQKVLASN